MSNRIYYVLRSNFSRLKKNKFIYKPINTCRYLHTKNDTCQKNLNNDNDNDNDYIYIGITGLVIYTCLKNQDNR